MTAGVTAFAAAQANLSDVGRTGENILDKLYQPAGEFSSKRSFIQSNEQQCCPSKQQPTEARRGCLPP
jgi:hypothetical protein